MIVITSIRSKSMNYKNEKNQALKFKSILESSIQIISVNFVKPIRILRLTKFTRQQ